MHSRDVSADIMLPPPLQGMGIGAQGPLSIPSLGKGVYEDTEVASLHHHPCGLQPHARLRLKEPPVGSTCIRTICGSQHAAAAVNLLLCQRPFEHTTKLRTRVEWPLCCTAEDCLLD